MWRLIYQTLNLLRQAAKRWRAVSCVVGGLVLASWFYKAMIRCGIERQLGNVGIGGWAVKPILAILVLMLACAIVREIIDMVFPRERER